MMAVCEVSDFNAKDSVNNQWIHLRKSGDAVKVYGVSSCTLGHEIPSGGDSVREGIFAGWEWNGTRLRVFNDRFGFYPLYYFVRSGECAVSPSLPELLALGAPTDLDYDAMAVFFHLGYFIGEDTPFQAIRAVPPSVCFEWKDGTCTVSSRLAFAKPQELDRRQAVDAYIELFRRAIVRRLSCTKEFGVLLSGGRDSRHILLELLRSGAPPKLCLTVDRREESDAVVAAQLARAVGVPHKVLSRREADFGEEFEKNLKTSLCADEHTWMLPAAQYLRGKVDAIYDGIGGDVLSAGLFLTQRRIDLGETGRWAELASDLISLEPIPAFLREPFRSRMNRESAIVRLTRELQQHGEAANPFSSFVFWNRTRREIALSPYGILTDVGAVYSPYLDHAVFDLLAGLSGRMFVDHSFHTEAINRAFPQYAHIPYSEKISVADRAAQASGGQVWRRFAIEILRHCVLGRVPMLNKRYVSLRLLRCLCDPGYLPSVQWLGPPSIYMFQLELFRTQSHKLRCFGQERSEASSVIEPG